MSDELREKIAAIVEDEVFNGDEDYWSSHSCHYTIANRILDLPDIAEGLLRMKQSERHDAMTAEAAQELVAIRRRRDLDNAIQTSPPE